jgi:hypothetical protein
VLGGYSTRGRGDLRPVGNLLHHTASSRRSGDSGALGICTNGRSDLPGPLCNMHVSRSGVITVVALGLANHAGKGSGRVLEEVRRGQPPSGDARARGLSDTVGGNGYFIGWECENDGIGEPWAPVQVDAIVRAVAGVSRVVGPQARHEPAHLVALAHRGPARRTARAALRPAAGR